MNAQATVAPQADPIMERLEDQIGWYDRKSMANQRYFKRIKVIEITAAAVIPFLSAFHNIAQLAFVSGGLGVLITVLEGLLHLNQYQQNWIAYRSTSEALKHEKYVYLAKAGPYSDCPNPYALLADRVESLVSQENAKWASIQQQQPKPAAG